MLIDKANKRWTVDFINTVANAPKGIERLRGFLSDKIYHGCYEEDPYQIYTYRQLAELEENILCENEIELSVDFVGHEEEIQIMTFDEFEEIAQKCLINKDI
ncbi:MAG: hypothetical protein NC120_10515 [Ruminococcus sp.]|nr:hypothetical protein [Ruminococcus sp.]